MYRKLLLIGLLLVMVFNTQWVHAQTRTELVKLAQEYESNGEYDKALDIYRDLFDEFENSPTYYKYYFNALLNSNSYKELEKAVRKRIRKYPDQLQLYVDLGRAYDKQGDAEAARKEYESAIAQLGENKSQYVQLANAFLVISENAYAIRVYETGRKQTTGYSFTYQLATLYYRTSEYRKSMELFVEHVLEEPTRFDNVCNGLVNMLDDEEDHLMLQEILYERIQKNNDPVLVELLVWDFIQQKDFESAFLQLKALDKRYREDGERIIRLAETAEEEKNYNAAIQAYEYVIEKGTSGPYYYTARNGILNARRSKITNSSLYTKEDLLSLKVDYLSFLKDYDRADYRAAFITGELAKLEAFYLYEVDSAILRLEEVITWQRLNPRQVAETKLVLGDLYLISGDIWEATLTYSQVDKAMKDDPLGEDARYRNARLAYYRGDFALAQGQLDVLKAATSELVANDALQLSVFITENLGLDSVAEPMEIYAGAELLFFQNRNEDALVRLSTLEEKYPGHPLTDDIYYMRFRIAMKSQEIEQAVEALETIRQEHTYGLLADNALFALGELYEHYLNDPEKALLCYEELILNFKDSIFSSQARKHYRRLRGDHIN